MPVLSKDSPFQPLPDDAPVFAGEDALIREMALDPRSGKARVKRNVSLLRAEKWWVEKSRDDPAAFIEYVTGKKPAKHHLIWLANLFHGSRDRLNFIAPRESGKAQPLDARVVTPTGYRLMGDLRPGDAVMGADGCPTQVTGIYPQGEQGIYRITFTDGSVAESTDDHLWSVRLLGAKDNNTLKVLPLRQIRTQRWDNRLKQYTPSGQANNWLDRRGQPRYHIPVTQPVQFDEKIYLLKPYTLGALIGDGGLTSQVRITLADSEIIDRVCRELPAGTGIQYITHYDYRITGNRGEVTQELRRLGLFGKPSNQKFIPADYLTGSIAQRHALLQGLMDTDGCAEGGTRAASPTFSTVSIRLAHDMVELVNSLGGTATIAERYTHYTHNGEYRDGQKCFVVSLKLPASIVPFYLRRKVKIYKHPTKYPPTRGILNIEYVGQKLCQCIKVDSSESLYLTDSYIVTHNTTISVYAMCWLMAKQPLLTNAVISVSSKQAEDRLRMIRSTIAENRRFRNVFPHIKIDSKLPDTQQEFSLVSTEQGMSYATWRTLVERFGNPKDPSIFVAGVGGRGIIGRRWSGLLLLDDLIDEETANDEAQEKAMRYIMQTLEPSVQAQAKACYIGTRWLLGDVPEQLKNNSEWHTVEISAIQSDPITGTLRSYWADFWSMEALEKKRRKMNNDALFNLMYLSNPSALTASLFTLACFERGIPPAIGIGSFREMYIATDTAAKIKQRNDWSVYYAVGVDHNDNYYIVGGRRFKATPDAQVDILSQFVDEVTNRWRIMTGVIWEDVAFQSLFTSLMAKARPDIPCITVVPKGDKGHRANLVSGVAKGGRLFIDQDLEFLPQLKSEWTNFPLHKHDDTLDPMGLLLQHLAADVTVVSSYNVVSNLLL